MADIAYWIFNYMPEWEAASKEVQLLLRHSNESLHAHLFSLNTRGRRIRLRGPEKYMPIRYTFPALPLLYPIARRHHINHLFSSVAESLVMPWVSRLPSILTVCKEAASVDSFERNRHRLARFSYLVVESSRHRDILQQLGIERVKTIYPPAYVRPYRAARTPFTVLFASSPFSKYNMLSRGIFLILGVARRLPHVQFVLAWRDHHRDELQFHIAETGVTNVSIVSGQVEMPSLYHAAHVTVLPGLDYASFKPCPHSAIESMAYGKPVLVSRTTSLADIVAEEKCGVVFEATLTGLENAIIEAMQNYPELQQNCHGCVSRRFSAEVFLYEYMKMYDELLSGRPEASLANNMPSGV